MAICTQEKSNGFPSPSMCPPRRIASGVAVPQFAGVTVDRSFDIWSLGMAVFHLYTGQSYFHDSTDPKVGDTVLQNQSQMRLRPVHG